MREGKDTADEKRAPRHKFNSAIALFLMLVLGYHPTDLPKRKRKAGDKSMKRRMLLQAAPALIYAPSLVRAQTAYPAKPIRYIVPVSAGGGSQSFNAVNQMRILGRWMRMLTIPNQSSIAKAFLEFDEAGRMLPSAYYDRVVDVMEELVKFTLLTRRASPWLTDRYSERKESAEALAKRVNQHEI